VSNDEKQRRERLWLLVGKLVPFRWRNVLFETAGINFLKKYGQPTTWQALANIGQAVS